MCNFPGIVSFKKDFSVPKKCFAPTSKKIHEHIWNKRSWDLAFLKRIVSKLVQKGIKGLFLFAFIMIYLRRSVTQKESFTFSHLRGAWIKDTLEKKWTLSVNFSTKKTVTHWYFSWTDSLFCQLSGEKKFIVVP